MKWKVGTTYLAILMLSMMTVLILLTSASSPDDMMMGTWEEVSWAYEKVDQSRDTDSLSGKEISEKVKQMISQDLIVHRAEKWEFLPGGHLKLAGGYSATLPAHWTLKGRGHILMLQYDNHINEQYTVAELDGDNMVLHFYTELQARGIAKITFRRIR